MAEQSYDSARVRARARQAEGCRKIVSDECKSAIAELKRRLDGEIEGRTADALLENLRLTYKRFAELDESLSTIARTLSRYADVLEEKDAQLQRLMSSR